MKIAVIPARGGSKRIPRKNIRAFAGLPMIAHAIRTAQAAGVFDRIIVSTDDDEIAVVAEKYGAEVPFRRPAELANDHASSDAVIIHAIQWCRDHGWAVDLVCCLYATVPLLQPHYIREALDLLTVSGKDFCFAVASFPAPIQRAFKLTPDGVEMFSPEYKTARSQDLTPAYHDAGQFYWGTAVAWLEGRDVLSHHAKAIVLPRHLVQDIDTEEDWTFAEVLYQRLQDQAKAKK